MIQCHNCNFFTVILILIWIRYYYYYYYYYYYCYYSVTRVSCFLRFVLIFSSLLCLGIHKSFHVKFSKPALSSPSVLITHPVLHFITCIPHLIIPTVRGEQYKLLSSSLWIFLICTFHPLSVKNFNFFIIKISIPLKRNQPRQLNGLVISKSE